MWLVAAVLLLVACGGGAARPERAEPREIGPLAMLVPEGAETIVIARPRTVASAPASRRVVDTVAPRDFVEAWAIRVGVNPYYLEEAVVAEFETGWLVIARGEIDAALVVRETGARMTGVEVTQDRPFVRRTGWLGNDHRDVVALTPNVVLVSDGTPAVMAAVLARAEAQLTGRGANVTPAALAAPDAAALYAEHSHSPLLMIAPSHIELPPGFATSVLLAQERALAVDVQPRGEDELRFEIDIRGDFPPGAAENFRQLVESVAMSTLGAPLGLQDALPTLRIAVDEHGVILRMTIRSSMLAMGLRVLFYAEIRELLADPPEAPNTPESQENPPN
jgi:hypothetical protein